MKLFQKWMNRRAERQAAGDRLYGRLAVEPARILSWYLAVQRNELTDCEARAFAEWIWAQAHHIGCLDSADPDATREAAGEVTLQLYAEWVRDSRIPPVGERIQSKTGAFNPHASGAASTASPLQGRRGARSTEADAAKIRTALLDIIRRKVRNYFRSATQNAQRHPTKSLTSPVGEDDSRTLEEALPDPTSDIEELVRRKLYLERLGAIVHSEVAKLSHRHQAILQNRFFAENPLTYAQLAELLGGSEDAIKVEGSRACKRLADRLRKRMGKELNGGLQDILDQFFDEWGARKDGRQQ